MLATPTATHLSYSKPAHLVIDYRYPCKPSTRCRQFTRRNHSFSIRSFSLLLFSAIRLIEFD